MARIRQDRERWFMTYVDGLRASVFADARSGQLYRCPCCRAPTLDARGGYDICPQCFWEDDGQDDHDASVVRGGPNGGLSLFQARQNYLEFGACEKRALQHVRFQSSDDARSVATETARQLAAIGAQTSGPSAEVRTNAARMGMLTLYPGWIVVLGIHGNNTVGRWNHEDGPDVCVPEPSAFLRRLALFIGVREYPFIAPLLPSRPANAQTCDACGGSGTIREPFVCSCGGAGWCIPGEDPGAETG